MHWFLLQDCSFEEELNSDCGLHCVWWLLRKRLLCGLERMCLGRLLSKWWTWQRWTTSVGALLCPWWFYVPCGPKDKRRFLVLWEQICSCPIADSHFGSASFHNNHNSRGPVMTFTLSSGAVEGPVAPEHLWSLPLSPLALFAVASHVCYSAIAHPWSDWMLSIQFANVPGASEGFQVKRLKQKDKEIWGKVAYHFCLSKWLVSNFVVREWTTQSGI